MHVLFGRATSIFELLSIVVGAILFGALTLAFVWNSNIAGLKKITQVVLALDIAGGVVANFTSGTNNYYAESLNRKYFFIFFHLLQPSLLVWIYPADWYAIAAVSVFTLTGSIIVLQVKSYNRQRVTAVSLWVACMTLATLLNFSVLLLYLTMLLYAIKLILAFSVNWASPNK